MRLDRSLVDEAAADGRFTGVLTVDVADQRVFEAAYGFAHRAFAVPNATTMRFAMASGSKAFTALAAMRLVEDGTLRLDLPVRDVLGADLPLIDDAVTIEHLLGHTSGIGDYLEEDDEWDPAEYALAAPVHTLTTAEAFLPVLDGRAQKFPPGERFSYCNGGYVVLALVLERSTGEAYQDAVRRLVFARAGLEETDFLRMDDLPGTVARGYLHAEGDRVNTLHLPVIGNGDGGAFTTARDLHRFWRALFDGAIVSRDSVDTMTRPLHDTGGSSRYGLGFWVHPSGRAVSVQGQDAGVSMWSRHVPATATTATALGNSSEGAWPVVSVAARALADEFDRA